DNPDETAALVEAHGAKVRTVVADLTDVGAIRKGADRVMADGEVDILVNNAGIIRRGPALEMPDSDWGDVLQVNLNSVFLLSQLFGGPMCERRSGKIINIASMLSFQGGINVASYAVSKHAVAGLTRALANEWAGRGANTAGLPISTVHRILQELVAHGWVREGEEHDYVLGPGLMRLAARAADDSDLARAARPALRALCERSGYTVHFGVRQGDEAV